MHLDLYLINNLDLKCPPLLSPRPHDTTTRFFYFLLFFSKPTPAEPITFLWVFTYPLSVYPPLVLPAVLAFIVTTVETIGDVTTTAEVSRLPVEGNEHFQVYSGSSSSGGASAYIWCRSSSAELPDIVPVEEAFVADGVHQCATVPSCRGE